MFGRFANFFRGLKGMRVLVFAACLCFCGCGEIFSQKPTEIQSQRIREEVRTIRPAPDPNVSIPEVYKRPPRIVEQLVGGGAEWKLFYFCKHHISDILAKMVNEQFAHKLFNEKGKSTTVADYTVSHNPATNQLVVRCPMRQDVEAVLEFLEAVDVPPIQVRIDCLISEIYADKTLDRETTIEIGHLLGEDISVGGSARLFGADVLELIQEGTPLPAFPGASLREVARSKMGLKIGYVSTKHNFLAVVDMLESKGYLKILMNPSLEVVNGQKASIKSSEHVPLEKIFLRDRDGFVEAKTEYVDVVDSLEIIPHVFADGYIGLETTIVIGSKNIPEGVKQIRIISKREIYNKENRIRPGESLMIGGIRKSEESSVVRGVPFLKDIPLLGVLFSSKDFEERAVETMFILTPTISSGGIPNQEMVENLRRKHAAPDYSEGLQEKIMDPLGFEARKQEHELRLKQLEEQRFQVAAEKEKIRRRMREAEAKAELATTKAEKAKQEAAKSQQAREEQKKKAEQALHKAEAAVAGAKKAKAETKKLQAELKKAKDDARKAKAEAEKAKTEIEKAKAEAEKTRVEAEKAKTEAKKTKEESAQAREDAQSN